MSAVILLVEDEEKLARFTELELVHEGYRVEKSGNGREALELALKWIRYRAWTQVQWTILPSPLP